MEKENSLDQAEIHEPVRSPPMRRRSSLFERSDPVVSQAPSENVDANVCKKSKEIIIEDIMEDSLDQAEIHEPVRSPPMRRRSSLFERSDPVVSQAPSENVDANVCKKSKEIIIEDIMEDSLDLAEIHEPVRSPPMRRRSSLFERSDPVVSQAPSENVDANVCKKSKEIIIEDIMEDSLDLAEIHEPVRSPPMRRRSSLFERSDPVVSQAPSENVDANVCKKSKEIIIEDIMEDSLDLAEIHEPVRSPPMRRRSSLFERSDPVVSQAPSENVDANVCKKSKEIIIEDIMEDSLDLAEIHEPVRSPPMRRRSSLFERSDPVVSQAPSENVDANVCKKSKEIIIEDIMEDSLDLAEIHEPVRSPPMRRRSSLFERSDPVVSQAPSENVDADVCKKSKEIIVEDIMEDSLDQAEIHEPVRSPPMRRRSSLSEISDPVGVCDETNDDNDLSRYYEKLLTEKEQWKKEVKERRAKYHDLKLEYELAKAPRDFKALAYNVLTDEDIEFLNAKPNISKLIDSQQKLHNSLLKTMALVRKANKHDEKLLDFCEAKVNQITEYILKHDSVDPVDTVPPS